MPHYVCLVSFTHEGLKNLKSTTKRAKVFSDKLEDKGIKILNTFWTVGRYDLVHIIEAPDDESAASLAFSLGFSATSAPRPSGPSTSTRWRASSRKSSPPTTW